MLIVQVGGAGEDDASASESHYTSYYRTNGSWVYADSGQDPWFAGDIDAALAELLKAHADATVLQVCSREGLGRA